RVSLVPKLADVVVLDHPAVGARRPREQREPALERHDHPSWELMAWGDIGEPRAGGQPVRLQSAGVDRRVGQPRAGRFKRDRDPWIVGLLDYRDVPGIEQDARGEVEALLRAAGDDDLIGLARDPSSALEIFGEGGAQRLVPGRVRIAERIAGGAPGPRGQEPAPDLARELVD